MKASEEPAEPQTLWSVRWNDGSRWLTEWYSNEGEADSFVEELGPSNNATKMEFTIQPKGAE